MTWVRGLQVLDEAAAIDRMYDEGEDITPLCGLSFVVKDLYDVAGYTTNAGNPVLGKGEEIRNHIERPCKNAKKRCSLSLYFLLET